MKRILFTFVILFVCLLSLQAQTVTVSLNFQGSGGSYPNYTIPVVIRNTDSSTVSTNPYTSINTYSGNAYHFDTMSIASGYTANLLSIHYYTCGQWHTIDTSFTGSYFQINKTILVPCYAPCNAVFSKSHSGPFSYQFNSIYNSSTRSHSWDFGDGNTSTAVNPQHTYTTTGVYAVSHNVIDNGGICNLSYYDTIIIDTTCKANFNISYSSSPTSSTIYITDSSSYNPNFYASRMMFWGDGNYSPINPTGNHHYSYPDSFQLTYVLSSSTGCSDTARMLVGIGTDCPKPEVNINSTGSSSSNNFRISISNLSQRPYTNYWLGFDNNTPIQSDYIVVPITRPDSFPVFVKYQSQYGCTDSFIVNKYFPLDTSINVLSVTAYNSPNTIGRVQLSKLIIGKIYSYYYLMGNGDTVFNGNEYWYNQIGNHRVTLVAYNSFGVLDSAFTYVNIVDTAHCRANILRSNTPDPGTKRYSTYNRAIDTVSIPGNNYKTEFTFSDNTSYNYTSGTINKAFPSAGSYIATMHLTDSFGLCDIWDYDTVQITAAGVCTADFTITGTGNTRTYTAVQPLGTSNPGAFEWNMGNGIWRYGQSVTYTYPNPGNYTVSLAVDLFYCSSYNTETVQIAGPCNMNYNYTNTAPFTIEFRRTSFSQNYPGTKWLFGDGDSAFGDTVSHTYAAIGTSHYFYGIALDSAGNYGCLLNGSFTFESCGALSGTGNQIYGSFTFDDTLRNDYDSVRLYVIGYDTTLATLTAVDSTTSYSPNDSGYFYFNLSSCTAASYPYFFVKAACLNGTKYYPNFLPTYYGNSSQWNFADTVLPFQNTYLDLDFIRGVNPGGPGFIGGYISQGANKNGAGLDGIQVNLFTENGDPVAYTYSFNSGRFEFSNLAYGKYKVIVEIPGKPSDIFYVTLDQDHQSVDEINFEVNSTYISTINSAYVIKANLFKAYPNPASSQLNIESRNGDIINQVIVYDIRGQEYQVDFKIQSDEKLTLDISGLKSGVYIVKAGNDRTMSLLRFIKN